MADAVYYTCATQVHSVIQGLTLPLPAGGNLPSAQVYLRKVLTDRGLTLPAVVVFLPPAGESMLGGTNIRDHVGYPIGVAIIVASNQDGALDTDDEEYLRWRELIRKAFHMLRLSGVTESRICRWEPAAVIDLGAWHEQNLWVQGGIVRCETEEART